jgi:hypothetical protein
MATVKCIIAVPGIQNISSVLSSSVNESLPWLRRLGSVHVGFMVDKVALGQVFHWVLQFSPVGIIIPPGLHTHVSSSGEEELVRWWPQFGETVSLHQQQKIVFVKNLWIVSVSLDIPELNFYRFEASWIFKALRILKCRSCNTKRKVETTATSSPYKNCESLVLINCSASICLTCIAAEDSWMEVNCHHWCNLWLHISLRTSNMDQQS